MFKRSEKIVWIPITEIFANPSQPRRHFEESELKSLADSIKQNGILQPLSIRKKNGRYELIAGERRLRAAQLAGLEKVPCLIMEVNERDSAVLALIENLQRQDLNFFEEAEGIARLIKEWNLSQEEVSNKLGKAQSTIANKLRLLRLSPSERQTIIKERLTERHARALLKIESPQIREKALNIIIQKGLNVSETDNLVESLLQTPIRKERRKMTPIIKDIRIFFNTIEHAVDLMRSSGVPALIQCNEKDGYIEYTIRIMPPPTQKSFIKHAE